MERAPPRYFSLMSSFAGIVIPKAVQAHIPQRLMMFDEKPLGHDNPEWLHYQVTTKKVIDSQIHG
jgi:hypothetical protein